MINKEKQNKGHTNSILLAQKEKEIRFEHSDQFNNIKTINKDRKMKSIWTATL